MSELTGRGKAFRATIAGFIGNKLKKAPKGADGNYASADNAECSTWLLAAAANIGDARVATHPVRMTHSSIKGASSIHAPSTLLPQRAEIGTHSAGRYSLVDFAISNSPQVPACQLLSQCSFDGIALIEWLAEKDSDLVAALDDGNDSSVAASLSKVLEPVDNPVSSTLAKQIYWLVGNEPQDDTKYHLLQPLFSSTLESALYEPLSTAKDSYFKARGTQKRPASLADHATYPDAVRRNIGGANPQNVSPLNSVRHGDNYLLTSLPPPAWKPRKGTNLRNVDSVFADKHSPFYFYGEVRSLIRELADFLKTDPEANAGTRDRVDALLQGIAAELAVFGAEVRGRHDPGWTRADSLDPPTCEQLWLDPERSELPPRDDSEHPEWKKDDLAFNEAYERGDWADGVATRFARWLNQQLRDRSDKLATLGEAEMRHFASQAVLDVAWPIPQQRHAKAGAA